MGDQTIVAETGGKCMPLIRIFNLVTGFTLIGFGIVGIISIAKVIKAQFFLVFTPIFVILFGILILAAECRFIFILKRVKFLQSLIGRGIFNIYLSSAVYYFFACGDISEVVGYIFAIILVIMGITYFVLHFCGGSDYNREIKEQMM